MPDLILPAAAAIVLAAALAAGAAEGKWEAQQTAVAIPMRDGKTLAADVFLPPTPGRYPTILIQTPYSRKRSGAAMPDVGAGGEAFDREHYAVVIVDWRGFYDSKPAAEGVRRPQRGRDGYDVVEWTARQAWSDGQVGTWGPSALGRIQFMTAQERPPHLTCCVPIVAANGYTYEDYYENGVYREAHLRLLDRLGFGMSSIAWPATRSSDLLYRLAARAHQPERLNVPILMITGWYEQSLARHFETFHELPARAGQATRGSVKLVVGPWHHTAIGEAKQGELEYPGAAGERDRVSRLFFDYWMRGQKANGWEQAPTFRWWQMGEERWLSAEGPAAVATVQRRYTLHGDGALDTRPPAADEPARAFVADPKNPVRTRGGANVGYGSAGGLGIGPMDQRPLESRDDVLVYTTVPLDAPLRVFGAVKLELTLSTDAKDASFALRLCDVYPDGRSMLVCDGITRAKYRDGADHAAPVEPGRAYTASLSLPPTAITLPKGHRLRVSVAGSNYPRFELNPHTGDDHYDAAKAVPAKCSLYHSATQWSTLVVPVLR